ncbi:MAG: sporulation initiation factor Spo0A C-terminal domain-containing protein [Erysipelotrichaceae bacterium]
MIKLFICSNHHALIKDLLIVSNMNASFQIVGTSQKELKNTKLLKETKPNILIITPSMNEDKCYKLLISMKKDEELEKIKIIGLFFNEKTPNLFRDYISNVVNIVIFEPYSSQNIFHAVLLLEQEYMETIACQVSLPNEIVTYHLIVKGIPSNLYGFAYLKTSVCMLDDDYVYYKTNITKLYDDVARKHHTTKSRVEKCMRTAIAHANGYEEKISNSQMLFDMVNIIHRSD